MDDRLSTLSGNWTVDPANWGASCTCCWLVVRGSACTAIGAGPGLCTVTVKVRAEDPFGVNATRLALPLDVVAWTWLKPTVPEKFWKNDVPVTGFSTTTTYRHRPGTGLATVFSIDRPCVPEPSGAALVLMDGVSPFGSTRMPSRRSPGSFASVTPTSRSFLPVGTSNWYENVCAGEADLALPPLIVPVNLPVPLPVGTRARTMTGTAVCRPAEVA